jgi:opacity protein-like surface antigen
MADRRQKINWNRSMRPKVLMLALSLVSAAVLPGVASAADAQLELNTSGTDPYLQDWRQVQGEAAAGNTKPGALFKLNTSGIDPYLQDWRQVQNEPSAGASGGVTPTDLARAYAPRNEGVAAAVDGRSVGLSDSALGFGLGLLLAAGCMVAIVLSRRRMRIAHS